MKYNIQCRMSAQSTNIQTHTHTRKGAAVSLYRPTDGSSIAGGGWFECVSEKIVSVISAMMISILSGTCVTFIAFSMCRQTYVWSYTPHARPHARTRTHELWLMRWSRSRAEEPGSAPAALPVLYLKFKGRLHHG